MGTVGPIAEANMRDFERKKKKYQKKQNKKQKTNSETRTHGNNSKLSRVMNLASVQ